MKITSGEANGYGRTLSQIMASKRNDLAECDRVFCEILARSRSATSLTQKQTHWHSGDHSNMVQWSKHQTAYHEKPEAEIAFHPFTPQGTLSPESLLIATVHFGYGTVHYFMNIRASNEQVGSISSVFLVTENGRTKLAGRAYPYAGEGTAGQWISPILNDSRFKEGIRGFIRDRYPSLFAKLNELTSSR